MVVADSFVKPNGLAFSPDERTLYVTDSGANQEPGRFHVHQPHHVVAYELAEGDVLVVPDGVPHQFVAVSDPFLYFVAKVQS